MIISILYCQLFFVAVKRKKRKRTKASSEVKDEAATGDMFYCSFNDDLELVDTGRKI